MNDHTSSDQKKRQLSQFIIPGRDKLPLGDWRGHDYKAFAAPFPRQHPRHPSRGTARRVAGKVFSFEPPLLGPGRPELHHLNVSTESFSFALMMYREDNPGWQIFGVSLPLNLSSEGSFTVHGVPIMFVPANVSDYRVPLDILGYDMAAPDALDIYLPPGAKSINSDGEAAVAEASKVPKVKVRKVSALVAKYHNAATGETWSGRGRRPQWLAAALASGKELSDFAT